MFTKKKTTVREQRLLVLLPAALILALYTFIIAIPRQRDLSYTSAKLNQFKQIAVKQIDAENSRIKLLNEQKALKALQENLVQNQKDIRQISEDWRRQESRLDAVQRLTELMEEFKLSISTQDYQENPKLTPYFTELTQIINRQFPETPLEFWQVELEGRYLDVTNFLAAVKNSDIQTVPLMLSMTAAESGNGQNHWIITFMI